MWMLGTSHVHCMHVCVCYYSFPECVGIANVGVIMCNKHTFNMLYTYVYIYIYIYYKCWAGASYIHTCT